MTTETRWGIMGTGWISTRFAEGLRHVPGARLVGVGSRSQKSASEFAQAYEIPSFHSSYDALANDESVDVVYVGTPHHLHHDCTMMALRAGKHVLCEKPFAINANEAVEMITFARERGLFLMEAMWTRFIPAVVRARELLAAGAIGEARMMTAEFGFRVPFDPKHRLLDLALGGGALLDVGVYPTALAHMIFGKPVRVAGIAHIGETGVDEQSAWVLGFNGGAIALCSAAIQTETSQRAIINGTLGEIILHKPFWTPSKLTLHIYGREKTEMELHIQGNGYNYQAIEVQDCLRRGSLESAIMPLDETLAIMETMDTLRAQWGLRYPMEA